MKVKVQLVKAGAKETLDQKAHRVFLRAIGSGATARTGQAQAPSGFTPVGKSVDFQPGRIGIAAYLSKSDHANIEARAERMTATTGELTMPADYLAKRVIGDYLRENGLIGSQLTAAKTLYAGKSLRDSSRQSMGDRLWMTVYVTPAEHEQLELLAMKAKKESVSDLVTDQVVPFWTREHPLDAMSKAALKSLFGPTPAAKESDPHEGIRNPHGPRPVIVPGQRY